MELERFATIATLEAQGWQRDALCADLHKGEVFRIGGPTYLRAPDGRIHGVTAVHTFPLDGPYRLPSGGSMEFVDGIAEGSSPRSK